ncbi:hypothetical protein [Fodinibius salicampi]|nr:hypothetical protein [Fodinibius salicampi]
MCYGCTDQSTNINGEEKEQDTNPVFESIEETVPEGNQYPGFFLH